MTAERRIGYVPLVLAILVIGGSTVVLNRVIHRDGDRSDRRDPIAEQNAGGAAADEDMPDSDVPGRSDVLAEERYVVRPGDTLGAIAARNETTVRALMESNGLRNADAVYAGQELVIRHRPDRIAPRVRLIPDSELVFGPAYRDFDLDDVLSSYDGPLVAHREIVDGEVMTGPDILRRVAWEFSVGPRILLAFVEARSGWVTGEAGPEGSGVSPEFAAGLADPARESLWHQLNWLADRLNAGYYGVKVGDGGTLVTDDDIRMAAHRATNPGSFAVQRAMALQVDAAGLASRLERFDVAYRRLFGDPWSRALPPLDLSVTAFPSLQLPWDRDEVWWMTGGPHGGWGDGSARAALDFVADGDQRGCFMDTAWVRAVADGVVLTGGDGQVWLDLDGDGKRYTGPVVFYLHVAARDRVSPGTRVSAGDRLGHPSCEGGYSNATHLHIARLVDGEWLAAGGDVPFVMGGWRAESLPRSYDGRLVHPEHGEREACECRLEGHNDVYW